MQVARSAPRSRHTEGGGGGGRAPGLPRQVTPLPPFLVCTAPQGLPPTTQEGEEGKSRCWERRRGQEGCIRRAKGRQNSSWIWNHISEEYEGKGNEEPHLDFDFYPTGTFRKPLERQVDEARRISRAEEVGKRKEVKVKRPCTTGRRQDSTLAVVL